MMRLNQLHARQSLGLSDRAYYCFFKAAKHIHEFEGYFPPHVSEPLF